MRNPLERYLDIAVGITGVTAQTAERLVQRLVKEGEVAADRAERVVADMLAASQRNREALTDLVRAEVERAVGRLNLASLVDVDELEERVVRRLREEGGVAQAGADPPDTSAEASAHRAPVTKRSIASRRTVAQKAAAQKTAAQRSSSVTKAAGTTGRTSGDEATSGPAPPVQGDAEQGDTEEGATRDE